MKKTFLCLLLAVGLLLLSAAAMAASKPDEYIFDINEGNITIENADTSDMVKVTYGNSQSTTDAFDPQDHVITVWGNIPSNSPQLSINTTLPVKINYSVYTVNSNFPSTIKLVDNADVTLSLDSPNCDVNGTFTQPGIKLDSGSKLTFEAGDNTLRISSGCSAILGPSDSSKPAATVILNSGNVIIADSLGISGNVNLVINGGQFVANGKTIDVNSLIITGGELWAGDNSGTKVTYQNLSSYTNIKCAAGILPYDEEHYDSKLFVSGDLTLPDDLTIPEGKTLTVPEGASLTIPDGAIVTIDINRSTLNISGTVTTNGTLNCSVVELMILENGILNNNGKLSVNASNLHINKNGILNNHGELIANCVINNYYNSLNNDGTISGRGQIMPPTKKLPLGKPASLKVVSIENDTVTLSVPANANATAEYSKDGNSWQDSPVFERVDLSAGQTFHARYKANNFFNASGETSITVYPVSLNANGGTIASGKEVGYYIAGQSTPLPAKDDMTRQNYSFAGWYDNSACTGTPITEIANDANTAKTFWAKWTPDTYNLTLITNGGTIKSGDLNSYTYGEGATLPTDVTRTGYTFAGWYDNSALTGDPVTEITKDATGEKKYWAKWRIVLTDPDGAIVSGDAAFAKLPPVKVPTLVLPEGTTLGGSVMLKYVEVDTTRENTAIYDVYLVDQDGNIVKPPEACTLCLPYPEGMDAASRSAYRIHILHEMDGGRSEDFDSVSGGLELTAQGLCVRISSLSPFTITWERFPEVNLPQTGDSSRPGLWLALGLVSAAALAAFALRGRKNGKA